MRTLCILASFLVFVTQLGCGGNTTMPIGPTNPVRSQPGEAFFVSGAVASVDGTPVVGAVVTMAHWLDGVVRRPSVVTDASGAYELSFTADSGNLGPRPTGERYVARAEVVADGYELYWYDLFAVAGSNTLVGNYRPYRIKRVIAGDSIVAAFPADVGACPGWVAERCGTVRVAAAHAGVLTVDVVPGDQSTGRPDVEICCIDGNERFGNPLAVPIETGRELQIKIGLRRDSTLAESFVVRTALAAK